MAGESQSGRPYLGSAGFETADATGWDTGFWICGKRRTGLPGSGSMRGVG
ncbi:MAG: hypothetical protein ABSG96_02095 [Terracidiphilus sp.]